MKNMEKVNRFMHELREMLGRYDAELSGGQEGEEVLALFLEPDADGDPIGHSVHNEYLEPKWDYIDNIDEGVQYMHCSLCIQEIKAGKASGSPKSYARQQAAWTKQGIQLWCTRHEANIIHIDFGGRKLRANQSRKRVSAEGEE